MSQLSVYKSKSYLSIITDEKGYTPNWTEEVFILDEIQFTNPITYKLEDLKEETIDGSFYGKELQKATEEVFRARRFYAGIIKRN